MLEGLAAVARERPDRPVEFLADFLEQNNTEKEDEKARSQPADKKEENKQWLLCFKELTFKNNYFFTLLIIKLFHNQGTIQIVVETTLCRSLGTPALEASQGIRKAVSLSTATL